MSRPQLMSVRLIVSLALITTFFAVEVIADPPTAVAHLFVAKLTPPPPTPLPTAP